MKLQPLAAGAHLIVDGRVCTLTVSPHPGSFSLVDDNFKAAREVQVEELHQWWSDGRMSFAPDEGGAGPANPYATLPEKDRGRILLRLSVLQAVAALPAKEKLKLVSRPHPETGQECLKPMMWHEAAKVCCALGRKPVGIATIYRWEKLSGSTADPCKLRGSFSEIGKSSPIDPACKGRLHELVDSEAQRAMRKVAAGECVRITPTRLRSELNGQLPKGASLPSVKTVAREIAKLPAYCRDYIKIGPRESRGRYRMARQRGIEQPEACLDRTEYDETRLNIVIVDEGTGVVLGIPWLSWFVDAFSTVPLGFYVGFEPMSDVSSMAALRHSCLPKCYVKSEYPSIKGELVCGVARGIVYDNGMTQHGNTIAETAIDLQFDYKFAPPYTPWFKGAVENMHRLLNDLLIDELPGFVIPREARPKEYDPKQNACIGLRHFLFILHHWIADVYLRTPTGPFSLRPIDRWREGTTEFPPRLLPNIHDLNLTFGILRPGNLDHRGVLFENLWYVSREMESYRRQHGHSFAVDVRANPTDLEYLYWRGPDQVWRRAEARAYSYARGRSLFQHKLVVRTAQARFGGEEEAQLLAAQKELQRLGQEALSMALPLRTSAQIARGLGYGTEHLFASHGLDGGLGKGTGPFANLAVNPFRDGQEAMPAETEETSETATRPRRRLAAKMA